MNRNTKTKFQELMKSGVQVTLKTVVLLVVTPLVIFAVARFLCGARLLNAVTISFFGAAIFALAAPALQVFGASALRRLANSTREFQKNILKKGKVNANQKA